MAVPRGETYTLSDYRALGPPFPGGCILAFMLFFCQLLDPPFSLVFSFFQSSNVFFYPRGMVACNFNLLHFSFVVLFAIRHTQFFLILSPFFNHFLSFCHSSHFWCLVALSSAEASYMRLVFSFPVVFYSSLCGSERYCSSVSVQS